MTEELNEDNTQLIQNTPAGTRERNEDNIQAIQRNKQILKINDIVLYKLEMLMTG